MDSGGESKTAQSVTKDEERQKMKISLLKNMKAYYKNELAKRLSAAYFSTFSIISDKDIDRRKFQPILKAYNMEGEFDPTNLGLEDKQSRAIGSLLGLGICDSLGASTEFIPFDKKRRHLIANGFEDIRKQIRNRVLDSRSGRVGIWTDDCSMALCMADSLLLNQFNFDPIHVRYMFAMWLDHGLNNGGRPYSIGLGGNISISMCQFSKHQTEFCLEGDKFNNGNGSLMRLTPIPICFSSNFEEAMKYSSLQSKTTHNGDEAAQCSRLLGALIVNLINREKAQNWKEVIDQTCKDFQTDNKSVKCLSLSLEETKQIFEEQKAQYKSKFTKFNKKLSDRNWNWKDSEFTYSPFRAADMPGYVGSYCMDALSMALHTIWHSSSFKEAAIINANMGGDCDTVGAIAGQLAGAIYGISADMLKLYSEMDDFKYNRFDLFLKGYKLYNRSPLNEVQKEASTQEANNE